MPTPWQRLFSSSVRGTDIDDLAVRLGDRLCHWITPAGLERCGRPPAQWLQLKPDEFAVLLHLSAGDHVHRGVILPCRWVECPTDSVGDPEAGVPTQLRELARSADVRLFAERCIRSDATAQRRMDAARLSLGAGCGDLSDLEVSPDSAGAVLAVTLAMFAAKFSIDQPVAVSATVRAVDGLGAVHHLEDKAEAARRAGMQRVFVAPGQLLAGVANPETFVPIRGPEVSAQLGRLMLEFSAPPAAGAFDHKWTWYDGVSKFRDAASRERAVEFYGRHLAVDTASHCDCCVPNRAAGVDTLVIIATGSTEVLLLALAIHKPSRVVVLTSDAQSEEFANQLVRVSRIDGMPTQGVSIESKAVDAWLKCRSLHDEPHRYLLDLTGGTTPTKVRVLDRAREAGIATYCIDTARFRSPKVIPL